MKYAVILLSGHLYGKSVFDLHCLEQFEGLSFE